MQKLSANKIVVNKPQIFVLTYYLFCYMCIGYKKKLTYYGSISYLELVSGVLQLGFLDLFGEKRLVIHSLLPLSFGLGINKLGFLISNFPCFSGVGASSIE